ncbi:MAG: DUF3048 domain-containing protein [Acidimicrobiales bacterium]
MPPIIWFCVIALVGALVPTITAPTSVAAQPGRPPCPTGRAGPIQLAIRPAERARPLKAISKSPRPAALVDGSRRPHPGYSGVVGQLDIDTVVIAPRRSKPGRSAKGISPLTGKRSKRANQPAVVVKVANTPRAIPQTGLHKADIVIEEQVEGGLTRFLAIFQTKQAVVGPVRSIRSTDIAIVNSLNTPAVLFSGGNRTFVDLIRQQDIIEVSEGRCPNSYRRISARKPPYNLYTRTGVVAQGIDSKAPPTQFRFRRKGDKTGGVRARRARITYSANLVDWQWHPKKKVWQRWQKGRPHTVAAGKQISAENVIIVEVKRVDSGLRDSGRNVVTEDIFVGDGRALILTKGRVIRAHWNRPSLSSVPTFVERKSGKLVRITRGKTWIQMAARGEYAVE